MEGNYRAVHLLNNFAEKKFHGSYCRESIPRKNKKCSLRRYIHITKVTVKIF